MQYFSMIDKNPTSPSDLKYASMVMNPGEVTMDSRMKRDSVTRKNAENTLLTQGIIKR
jgi:hypothetical protein